MNIDTDDPDASGVLHLELGFVEGFRYDQRHEVLHELQSRFGPFDPERSKTDPERSKYRGGPHTLGATDWWVWELDTLAVLADALEHSAPEERQALAGTIEEITFQINWAENLPFMIGYGKIQLAPGELTEGVLQKLAFLGEGFDKLLDDLPGRLSRNNRHPRVTGRWIVGAKVTADRMARMREAAKREAESPSGSLEESSFRRELQEVSPILGETTGPLLVSTLVANVLHVHGEEGYMLSDPRGPFSAFLFSTGRLMASTGPPHWLPLWIPRRPRDLSWDAFNFMPFLHCSSLFADSLRIETGAHGERLGRIAREAKSTASEDRRKRRSAWQELRDELVELQATLDLRSIQLEKSRARSIVAEAMVDREGDDWLVVEPPPIPSPFTEGPWTGDWISAHVETKQAWEREAAQLLENTARRARSVFESISSDYHWEVMTATQRWTVLAVITAGIAALAALANLFLG